MLKNISNQHYKRTNLHSNINTTENTKTAHRAYTQVH
jgi:hypothetical protein